MLPEQFMMPLDGDMVLHQGWITRESRRRRKSDASIPFNTTENTTSSAGRRRNTVAAANFHSHPQTHSLPAAPPQGQVLQSLASPETPLGSSTCSHDLDPAPSSSFSMPAESQLSEEAVTANPCGDVPSDMHMIVLTPLSPPQSPREVSSLANTSRKRQGSLLQPPQTPLPAIPEQASTAPTTPTTQLSEFADDMVKCIVLDSKKICLARPRLIQIRPH
ncbi:hypothetical protein COEREDRAFT_11500 [Coemansia reversa NRRL 1564]|uniref:Uncharacterized protein n=1 Tax=Coemansia reversa (strain ATCC 12441 / NRRL 1564) TaxID=763665 RepID=A0A2G5B343_COERN|nr:hypothetical protein COEREDRAFT_11500 [Coemansia reversa NRRL 1564]|eukprot:PIA13415.1 hypothetical protein COEREDRAFT_11500 [Coemansia reversa NRRL 1564]